MIRLIQIFILLLSVGCGLSQKSSKKLELDRYYQSSQIQKYILSPTPAWANFVTQASCYRSNFPSFLSIPEVAKSYRLSYSQAILTQDLFNQEMNSKQRRSVQDSTPRSQEKVFFESLDKVQSGIYAFIRPNFKRVHAIWLDGSSSRKSLIAKLKRLFKRRLMKKGHPVVFSYCLSREDMQEIILEAGLSNRKIQFLPASLSSIFDKSFLQHPQFFFPLQEILGESKKIYLFRSKGLSETGISGHQKTFYY